MSNLDETAEEVVIDDEAQDAGENPYGEDEVVQDDEVTD